MKPSLGAGNCQKLPPKNKINETLAKLLKAVDSSSYSKINTNNKLTNERNLYKTKSTSIQNKSKLPSFIKKPSNKERNTSIKTSYSPPNSQVQTNSRIQTEPPVLTNNQSYLNSLIKQRIPTAAENRIEPAYFIDALKAGMKQNGKSFSAENNHFHPSKNKSSSSLHRRHKTLLNLSNDSSVNLSNLTSNFIQVPQSKENAVTNNSCSIEGLLKDFLLSNVNGKNLSVLQYLEKFFELLDFLNRKDCIFGIIKEIVQLPFRRISEQFESIKSLYKEKIMKVEFLTKEREKTDIFLKNIVRENDNLKGKIKEFEELIEKMKEMRPIVKLKQKSFLGDENRVPNLNLIDNKGVKKEFNEELKQKLRLNLDVVKRNTLEEEMKKEMGNLQQISNNKNIIGFHDEFMSKFEEFSISWKNKALAETKFH